MTLALVWPAGLSFGEIVASNDLEALDSSQAQAIDGSGGGTYAPVAKIVVNGAGFQVNNLTVTGALTLLGNETIGNSPSDTLSVLATSTFSAPVTFNNPIGATDTVDFSGNFTVHSGAVSNLWGNVQIGLGPTQTLDVEATATANAPWGFNDTVDMGGQLTVHSGADARLWGNVELGSAGKTLSIASALETLLNLTGPGRVPLSWGGVLSGASQTIHATDGQIFKTYAGTLTGGIGYTLSTSGATAGDWMLFFQGPTPGDWATQTIAIKYTATASVIFQPDVANQFAIFAFNGSAWVNVWQQTG